MTQKNVKTLSPASVIFVGEAEFCQRADVRRVAAGRAGRTVTVMPGAPGEPQHSVSSAAGESEPPRDWQHEAQAGPGRTDSESLLSQCHSATRLGTASRRPGRATVMVKFTGSTVTVNLT